MLHEQIKVPNTGWEKNNKLLVLLYHVQTKLSIMYISIDLIK